MKSKLLLCLALTIFELLSTRENPAMAATAWNIVWSDEFNGTSINTNNWTFDIGNGFYFDNQYIYGWGNNELEYYTDSTNNAYVSDGLLHIVQLQQSTNGFSFTSARLKTEGLYTTTYGRIQWRAALPSGTGIWPGLWLLGADFDSVGWPACGEIDVVENNGATPIWAQGSIHSGTNGDVPKTTIYNLPSGEVTTNFHIYELDWSATSISWLVDGVTYETRKVGAPFNAPFYILMNVAVGGNYVGQPSTSSTSISNIEAGTVFPQAMLVDYVRVYEQTDPLQISTTQSNGDFILNWPTNIVCHLQALTNSLVDGNWTDMNSTTNPFVITPDQTQPSVFYRLESP